MKILFLGDIIGTPGRLAVTKNLPFIIKEFSIDFVIASAGCSNKNANSIMPEDVSLLIESGVNCITTGEKIWYREETVEFLKTNPVTLLRPLNYPPGVPGIGSAIYSPPGIAVINLLGRAFLSNIDCPFRIGLQEIEKLRAQTKTIIIDFHAQTTAEKQAFSYWADGKVSAVIGTQIYVPTTDEKILPKGTAYISSIGFSGVKNSIGGLQKESYIEHFLTGMPLNFAPATGDTTLNSIILEINSKNGAPTKIQRFTL